MQMIWNTLKRITNDKQLKFAKKRIYIDGQAHTIEYYNMACAMDTETSSFYNNQKEKVALMYCHQWKIEDAFYLGRTWDDFRKVCELLRQELKLSDKKRVVVYVHNLPYEFQFMRKEIEIDSVFAVSDRQSIKVVSKGIEFRDSLILSQKNLEKVGEEVNVKKLKEIMNYDLIRTPLTPLTDNEKAYCYNDVDILVQYIRKKIKEDGNIAKIPMTNTGYVRNAVRKNCFSKKYYRSYRDLMKYLTITSYEYKMLKRAFQGGYVHANARFVNVEIKEPMRSDDIGSSYPTAMLSEKYPMSKARKCQVRNIEKLMGMRDKYCFILNISFHGLSVKENIPDSPLSKSKCQEISNNCIINNGRVMYADFVSTTITDVDLEIFQKFFDWEDYDISEVICYQKGYLPKPIIESVWMFYKAKTELKGICGSEEEYALAKAMLNSIYGMIVTDIIRDEYGYEMEWNKKPADVEEQIDHYNKSGSRFLFYPWGVWVTAYARRNLLEGILEAGNDYVYADTDSRKIINPKKHIKWIEEYNENITEKIKECFKYHGMEYEIPKNSKGIPQPLGAWDNDGLYTRFKTLGAKRYIYEGEEGSGVTIAGIPKKTAILELANQDDLNRLLEQENTTYETLMTDSKLYKKISNNCRLDFDKFTFGLTILPENSGKLTHTYIDVDREGYVKDYMGKEYEYHVKSSVHLEKAPASITLSGEFGKYLLGVEKYKGVEF